ncbi:hypothetical protein PVAND_004765 [Polypedilum vanderplanki]|uniref:Uncharacterized protein n=1 Tax=Polypedilum vanderplanki TaxID=319348 RepID=A0A9J6BYK1_POLVA|nr:hypothetical protein PVAND_004765 [Polypedilum vanderplanki]
MKILFAFLLIFSAAVFAYPVDEILNGDGDNINVDEILNKIPDDIKVDEINELLRRIADIIFNDPAHVIDAPIVCPPGYKVNNGMCRPVMH